MGFLAIGHHWSGEQSVNLISFHFHTNTNNNKEIPLNLIILRSVCSSTRQYGRGNDFDVLIFTQQWPATVCYEWMEEKKDHACLLPSAKDVWTIHGIWPTKYGTLGPFHCNDTWVFDINQVAGIEKQMEQFWINIEKGLFPVSV